MSKAAKIAHLASSTDFPKASLKPDVFVFDTYEFNYRTLTAYFHYVGKNGLSFCETIHFAKPSQKIPENDPNFTVLLDSALKLAFYLVGVSYYKTAPTKTVKTFGLDEAQAKFFSTVYQDGLSQFAFTNHLAKKDLATFTADSPERLKILKSFRAQALASANSTNSEVNHSKASNSTDFPVLNNFTDDALILQSGGKDSLLNATLCKTPHTFFYLSANGKYPELLNTLNAPLQVAIRHLDRNNLSQAQGLNGHIPVTYIVMSLALIQAILNRQKTVFTSIGQEGNEPHFIIRENGKADSDITRHEPGDFPVNHQWSKTAEAEKLFRDYVHTYISPELDIYSPLRQFTELKIAKLFAENCWEKYGHQFSSCNVINYTQNADNHELRWCGNCSKCANSYLLFAPFVPRAELDSIFDNKSLFENPKLINDFQGLLHVGNHTKPFECVGETDELRYAYHHRRPEYPKLPFDVPEADFDLDRNSVKSLTKLFTDENNRGVKSPTKPFTENNNAE